MTTTGGTLLTFSESVSGTGAAVGVVLVCTDSTGATVQDTPVNIDATTGDIDTPGSITSESISMSNGNLVFGTAGNKIIMPMATSATAGANAAGVVTLVAGTATVTTTAVTANSRIKLSRQSIGATGAAALGQLVVGTITAGTSFVINAATTATANTVVTTDVSVVYWEIVDHS